MDIHVAYCYGIVKFSPFLNYDRQLWIISSVH